MEKNLSIKILKTMWGATGSVSDAIDQLIEANMDGLEGPAPETNAAQLNMLSLLEKHQLHLEFLKQLHLILDKMLHFL